MLRARDVIIRPLVTEKTSRQQGDGIHTFIVRLNASKPQIARAVESLWDVEVRVVRTMRYAGKAKRALLGRMAKNWSIGRRPAFKKAIVQLSPGDEIEYYEVG